MNNMFISFLYASVLAGAPLLFGTLGEIITEKAGNLNLGVEGMMYMGAVIGFYLGYVTKSAFLAIIGAFVAGALGALIYALLTVTFKANQNVTGLTLTIFGTGFANYVGDIMINSAPNRTATLADSVKHVFDNVNIPFLSSSGTIGKLFFQYNILVYFGVILAIIAGLYFNHTRMGLNLRAVGESPAAADAAGINVTLYKYVHILLGGGICGIGGAYVSIVTCNGTWTNNAVNGLGWISVALVIFASWKPYRSIFGSLIFGALSVLVMYIPKSVINIPNSIFQMLPFLVTAIVLVVSSIRQSKENTMPKSCGMNYFREER